MRREEKRREGVRRESKRREGKGGDDSIQCSALLIVHHHTF
jgi:hypothetical protein